MAEQELFSITDKAAEMVRNIMEKEGKDGKALRVNVMPGGCAGYTYGLDFADEQLPDDLVVETSGVKVYVNEDIEPLVKGSKLDFVESLNGAGFVLDNPNSQESCGCGKSFM